MEGWSGVVGREETTAGRVFESVGDVGGMLGAFLIGTIFGLGGTGG